MLSFHLSFFLSRNDRDTLFRLGSFVSFGVAFVLGSVWTQSLSFGMESSELSPNGGIGGLDRIVVIEDHQMSPGVVFAAVVFVFGKSPHN